jgi:hypothetical protein
VWSDRTLAQRIISSPNLPLNPVTVSGYPSDRPSSNLGPGASRRHGKAARLSHDPGDSYTPKWDPYLRLIRSASMYQVHSWYLFAEFTKSYRGVHKLLILCQLAWSPDRFSSALGKSEPVCTILGSLEVPIFADPTHRAPAFPTCFLSISSRIGLESYSR